MLHEEPKIRISSSVANFKDKLLKRTNLTEWNWDIFEPTIFVGMYHWGDYLRYIIHRGPKKLFWCGADLLQVSTGTLFLLGGTHYVENVVEQRYLEQRGKHSIILPMIFTDFKSEDSFVPSSKPHVFLTSHNGRRKEYGLLLILQKLWWRIPDITFHIYGVNGVSQDNVIFHGQVPEEQFNEEIKHYHGALRLNEFDGFAETVAKSILLGQYPITRIPYPGIDNYSALADLTVLLEELKTKDRPNPERFNWEMRLNSNLARLLNFGESSNGRTNGFEPLYVGPNPTSPA